MPGKKTQFSFDFNDLQLYLAILLKHLRLIILVFCMCGLLALAFYIYKRPVYYASTWIRVVDHMYTFSEEQLLGELKGGRKIRWDPLNLIDSPMVRAEMAETFGIDPHAFSQNPRVYVKKVDHRGRKIFDDAPAGSVDTEWRVWAATPELARNWIRIGIEKCEERRNSLRDHNHMESLRFISGELARMQQARTEWEETEKQFMEQTRMPQVKTECEALQNAPKGLIAIDNRLKQLDDYEEFARNPKLDVVEKLAVFSRLVTDPGLRVGEIVPVTAQSLTEYAQSVQERLGVPTANEEVQRVDVPDTVPASPALAEGTTGKVIVVPSMIPSMRQSPWLPLENERRALTQQKNELSQKYLPGHPKMAAVVDRLTAVNKGLESILDALMERLQWERARLLDQKEKLTAQVDRYEEVSSRLADIQRQYNQLKAMRLPYGKYIEDLAERLTSEKARFSNAETAPERFQSIYMGLLEAGDYPASPNRAKLILAAFALAFAISASLVAALELLDHTFTVLENAEERLALKGLGIVPLLPQAPDHEVRYLITGDTGDRKRNSSFIETFRILRANIERGREFKGKRQVIMTTSSIPREGKSFVAANLALTYARTGERTLLIDADTRRASMRRTFGMPRMEGLLDVLRGTLTSEEAVLETETPNLYLLQAGKDRHNAAELLAGPMYMELMAELRTKFDRIIVDTPPVLGLSEACELLPSIDGVLLIVWAGYTPMHEVNASINLLRSNGAQFFGFVLNRVDLNKASNYYHYYYYSDYYYRSYQHRLPEALPEALPESTVLEEV